MATIVLEKIFDLVFKDKINDVGEVLNMIENKYYLKFDASEEMFARCCVKVYNMNQGKKAGL